MREMAETKRGPFEEAFTQLGRSLDHFFEDVGKLLAEVSDEQLYEAMVKAGYSKVQAEEMIKARHEVLK